MLPLEIINPVEYGTFDAEQRFLIRTGSYDIVLIENATELFRQVMHGYPDSLEIMLEAILPKNSNFVITNSETFQIDQTTDVMPPDLLPKLLEYKREQIDTVPADKNIVTIIGIDLPDAGGHYASFIWLRNVNRLLLFDSMATVENKFSFYGKWFRYISNILFDYPEIYPVPITYDYSLQETGGFPENMPIDLALMEGHTKREKRIMCIQCTESQNHFCYMWSIWAIHAILNGNIIGQLQDEMTRLKLNPLYVIKRYSWTMLKFTGLYSRIKHKKLFDTYFPRIWLVKPGLKIPFLMRMPPVCKNAIVCLKSSVSPVTLIQQPLTPVPPKVMQILDEIKSKRKASQMLNE